MRMSEQQRAVLGRMTSRLRFRDPYPTCATLYLDLPTLDQFERDEAMPLVVNPATGDEDDDALVLQWVLGGEEFRLFADRIVLGPKPADVPD